jgi:AraC-like DNA-binding protein
MNSKLNFDWYLLFVFLGVCQAVFLSILIYIKNRKSDSRFVFLSLFLFSLGIILSEVLLNYSGYMLHMIRMDKFSFPFQFLIAPSIFLFIKSSLDPGRPGKIWIHYSVFAAILLYFMLYYFQDNAFKLNLHIDDYNLNLGKLPTDSNIRYDPFYIHKYFHIVVFAHLFVYVFFIWGVLSKKYKELGLKMINNEESYINHYRNLLFYYILALLLMAILLIKYVWFGDLALSLYLTCIIYIISINISYKSLNHYFHNKQSVKYASSSLNESDKKEILDKIKHVVEDEAFYCQSNASLEEISRRIKVSKHNVSQVINELLGKSLFEYLADQRISRSQLLLSDPKYHNLTIDEISFMVGYNSRSAFNRVFKSMTGTTPAEYRRQYT